MANTNPSKSNGLLTASSPTSDAALDPTRQRTLCHYLAQNARSEKISLGMTSDVSRLDALTADVEKLVSVVEGCPPGTDSGGMNGSNNVGFQNDGNGDGDGDGKGHGNKNASSNE